LEHCLFPTLFALTNSGSVPDEVITECTFGEIFLTTAFFLDEDVEIWVQDGISLKQST
jgi:hypothetical protein